MSSAPLFVDRAEVRSTDAEVAVALGAAAVHVLHLRRRYDAPAEEVINSAGLTVAGMVNAWTLIGQAMSLET